MTNMRRVGASLAFTALVALGTSTQAQAQTTMASGPWSGLHLGASFGAAVLRDSAATNTVVFDKNLDGVFTDSILTAAGANAFSPGFCTGVSVSTVPSSGCAQDTRGRDMSGRVGYDWQMGRLVFGAIGELSMADLTDSVTAFSTTPASYTFTREIDWVGTFGLRLGVAGDRWLIYGSGGAAYAGLEQTFATSNTVNTFTRTAEDKVWGYSAGGGIDWRLAPRVTVGAVYAYTSLNDEDQFTVRAQGPAPATNPFILTNASGTDMQRADKFQWHSVRGVVSIRF